MSPAAEQSLKMKNRAETLKENRYHPRNSLDEDFYVVFLIYVFDVLSERNMPLFNLYRNLTRRGTKNAMARNIR